MKKFTWIAALLATLALVFVGCPTDGGDDDPKTPQGGSWYLAAEEGGTAAENNAVVLNFGTGDAANKNVYIYFDAPGNSTYTRIKIAYTLDPGQNISLSGVYDSTGTWGPYSYIAWGDGTDPIEIDPATCNEKWGATGDAIDKASVKGCCLVISGTENTSATFTLTGVSFE